jgi:hypothetical protein
MILEKRLITPEVAADMLSRNIGNRLLRPRVVKAYATDMTAGQWRLTHEAIAVTAAGQLLNGQHRLHAVVQSGRTQTFWVAVYETSETAMDLPIDCGARRNTSDILRQDKMHVQTAGAVFRYAIVRHAGDARPFQVQLILDAIGQQIIDAANVSRGRTKLTGSAMARAAIVCNLVLQKGNPEAYRDIIESYRSWHAGENAAWPSVEALNKQAQKMHGRFTPNIFCRIAFAFNPDHRDFQTIRISPEREIAMLDALRGLLQPHMPDLFPDTSST